MTEFRSVHRDLTRKIAHCSTSTISLDQSSKIGKNCKISHMLSTCLLAKLFKWGSVPRFTFCSPVLIHPKLLNIDVILPVTCSAALPFFIERSAMSVRVIRRSSTKSGMNFFKKAVHMDSRAMVRPENQMWISNLQFLKCTKSTNFFFPFFVLQFGLIQSSYKRSLC